MTDSPALLGPAELALQVAQQGRVADLAASAVAEDAADQPGDSDDVRRGPRLQQEVKKRVLDRQQRRVGERLGDVGIDPLHVLADHLHREAALRAVFERQRVDLGVGLCGRVRCQQQFVVVHLLVGAGRAEERGERALAVVAKHVHEEKPVLSLGVPSAERQRGVRLPVDMGDVVGVPVDDHGDLRRGVLGGDDLAGLHPEGLAQVVLAQRRVGERGVAELQVLIRRELVLAVRRALAGLLELRQLCRVDQAVLPRGQDEHGLAVGEVIGLVHRPQGESARAGRGQGRCASGAEGDRARQCSNPPRTPQFAHGRHGNHPPRSRLAFAARPTPYGDPSGARVCLVTQSGRRHGHLAPGRGGSTPRMVGPASPGVPS